MDFLLNINDLLGDALKTDPNLITAGVLGLCIVLLICAFIFPKIARLTPSLMVSIGICGTFWGTYIALFEFQTGTEGGGGVDHQAMVDSIPNVLSGMKSAFLTSLIGLGAALLTRLGFLFLNHRKSHQPTDETLKDLLAQIKDGIGGEGDRSLYSQMQSLKTEFRDGMGGIKQSLSGEDNESSVVSHLIKMRNENSDNFKKLNEMMGGLSDAIRTALVNSMEELKDELRKAITEQLAPELEKTNKFLRERLEEMMKELQEKLVEQFGKSFEEFNQGIKAINQWQQEHRRQVEQLTEAFRLTAQGIEEIRASCEDIPKTMNTLRELMGELDMRVQAFADMKQQAENSFPIIKEHLDQIGLDMRQSSEGFSGLRDVITNTFTESDRLVREQADRVQNAVADCVQEMRDSVTTAFTESNNLVTSQVESVTQLMNNSINTMQQSIQDSFEKSNDLSQKQVNAVSESVQTALAEMSDGLSEMREKHTAEISEQIEAITEAWGENMIAVADRCAEIIRRQG